MSVNIEIEAALPADEEDAARQRIMDAARDLYLEQGLKGTTMEDVARRAGMGRATLYRRFSEKDQLFQALILRDVQRDLVMIEHAIRNFTSALDGLLEAFVKACGLMHHNALLSHLLNKEPEHVLPYLTSGFEVIMQFSRIYLSGQIIRAQQAGHIKQLPPDMTSEVIMRMMQSLILTPHGVIDASDDASLRKFADLYLRPLLTP
ncbi:MAG TPA: helix-turn-helix domain-containing protein [Dongiaceae bacterium]|nr:helix-turn-helix domain-containing protein [Dongiaceae bacterium]